MKQETFEKAQEIKKQIKALEAARDTITRVIDQHSAQSDLLDDNDNAARVNQAHIDYRNNIETLIGELNHEFDQL